MLFRLYHRRFVGRQTRHQCHVVNLPKRPVHSFTFSMRYQVFSNQRLACRHGSASEMLVSSDEGENGASRLECNVKNGTVRIKVVGRFQIGQKEITRLFVIQRSGIREIIQTSRAFGRPSRQSTSYERLNGHGSCCNCQWTHLDPHSTNLFRPTIIDHRSSTALYLLSTVQGTYDTA